MEDWVQILSAGGADGWNTFLTRFNRLVYKVFCTRSFGFSRDDIEELFNDFLVSLMKNDYKKVRLFEGRNNCSFASYLKKIAINMAIDRRKTLMRQRMTSLQMSWEGKGGDDLELVDLIDSGEEVPEDQLIHQEEAEAYLSALYELAPSKLIVVLMIVYHDYDREKLAKILGTTRQNIDVIYNRSKEQLKKLLARKPGAEREATPWRSAIESMKGKLLLADRDLCVENAVQQLKPPEEMLVGVVFINSISLDPTPERLGRVLKSDEDTAQNVVEEQLKKITPGQ